MTCVSDQDASSVSRETGSFKPLCLSAGAGATGCTVGCSNSGVGKRCLSSSYRPDLWWGPPSLLYDGYRFLGAFAKLRKVSFSFVMSVRPSKWCLVCTLATKLNLEVRIGPGYSRKIELNLMRVRNGFLLFSNKCVSSVRLFKHQNVGTLAARWLSIKYEIFMAMRWCSHRYGSIPDDGGGVRNVGFLYTPYRNGLSPATIYLRKANQVNDL
jgi:hypothetical protein